MDTNNFKIDKIVTKYYTNTYFVFTDSAVAVIDPGGNANKIIEVLQQNGQKDITVLLTHGHFDHVLSVAEVIGNSGRAYMSLSDDYLVKDGGHLKERGIIVNKFDYTSVIDGDIINVGDAEFKVLSTPGHTPGSVCYILGNYIFSGDTLFSGSIGRTDFPGGNVKEMSESLKRLSSLRGDYLVFPGHGQQTTLEKEKQSNPYLD